MPNKNLRFDHPMPDTQWSLVARADDGDTVVRRHALAEILERYLPALEVHLTHELGIRVDQARDLLQGFIADKVLEQFILAAADQARGRFRNFLLTALDNYVREKLRFRRADIRDDATNLSLETVGYLRADQVSPADAFDVTWARQLLQTAMEQMQARCRDLQRPDVWDVFQQRIVAPLFDNTPPPSYNDMVARFGFATPAQAHNTLLTSKRMFARILRTLIADYEVPTAIDEEINDLFVILARQGATQHPRRQI